MYHASLLQDYSSSLFLSNMGQMSWIFSISHRDQVQEKRKIRVLSYFTYSQIRHVTMLCWRVYGTVLLFKSTLNSNLDTIHVSKRSYDARYGHFAATSCHRNAASSHSWLIIKLKMSSKSHTICLCERTLIIHFKQHRIRIRLWKLTSPTTLKEQLQCFTTHLENQ